MGKNSLIIGVDPGEIESGVVVILGKMVLKTAIIPNDTLITEVKSIQGDNNLTVIYEDIKYPFIGMRSQTITTCKFIGVMDYLLRQMDGVDIVSVERVTIRKWVYDNFPRIARSRVVNRIAYLDDRGKRLDGKRYLNKDGKTLRTPSFHFVDDRIVMAALRSRWRIPVPKPGKTNRYGLKSHIWSALALVTAWRDNPEVFKCGKDGAANGLSDLPK